MQLNKLTIDWFICEPKAVVATRILVFPIANILDVPDTALSKVGPCPYPSVK